MAISSTSSTSPQTAFNFDGVISGLQTGSIINAMVSLQQAPITALQNQITTDNARDAAYQSVSSAVSSFQTALQSLLVSNNVMGTSATTSTSGILTATASSAATTGPFQVWVSRLATATSVTTGGAGTAQPLGTAIDPTQTLANAGFATTPTVGTFTINGKSINVSSTDTLNSVIGSINSSGAGVTASLVNDAYGRANVLQVKSNTSGQVVQLGSAGDTSNFLSAMGLVASGTDTVTSADPLGTINAGAALSAERTNLGSIAASGSFSINGTTINWTNSDSLNTIIGRINSSGAGVTAGYNQQTDQLTLTNSATGSTAMTLSDTSGNFLQTMGLVNGSNQSVQQSYGQTAAYAINNQSNVQYSNSNTITNALPGVTLNLQSAQASGSGPVTVTVARNTSGADANVQSFVSAYNTLMTTLDSAVQESSSSSGSTSTTPNGPLAGDPSILQLQSNIRQLMTNAATGSTGTYTTLASIGISTGAAGSTSTSPTDQLTFNQSTFEAALQANPNAVYAVLSGLSGTAVLNPNGSGVAQPGTWIQSATGTPSNQTQAGSYQLSYNGVNTVTATFTPTNGVAQPSVTESLAPGASTSTLIPGMTITAQSSPPSGGSTDTIQFNVTQEGVLQNLNSYVSQALGAGGIFNSEKTTNQTAVQNLNDQITQMNQNLDTYRQTLQSEFTAMEASLASLQSQSANLISMMGGSSSSSTSSSSTGMSSGASGSTGH